MRSANKLKFLGAFALSLLTSASSFAADHRDSPSVDQDPAADINDVYMFRDPANAANLVLVLSTFPLEDPRFSPSYEYDPDVVFQICFDTKGKGVFSPASCVTAQYSPVVNGPGSQQTMTVTLPNGAVVSGNVTLPTVQPMPSPRVINTANGVTAFAGQSDDPFFFDLIGFNRVVAKINATSVNGGPGVADPSLFTHVDAFARFNVQALVIEAPITDFVGSATKFGISAFSYRKVISNGPNTTPDSTIVLNGARYRQVDRMGNPAVNTAFISPSLKDSFNHTRPKDDANNYAATVLATLKKFGTDDANTAILASVVFPDTLKIDLSQPDGFPNGRRLADDVIDTELQLAFNQPLGGGFGDGVNHNDVAFQGMFPYVGLPHIAPAAATASSTAP